MLYGTGTIVGAALLPPEERVTARNLIVLRIELNGAAHNFLGILRAANERPRTKGE
jgi:hypothetical protein